MKSKVRLLDSHTVNQIAAGEVVDRPSSVVKELIENALDAGASQVEIFLEQSGKNVISVRDNGSGMSLEDAKTCLLRHATSKITDFDDLYRVTSFGFRGEAIPSIASVSRLKLSTGEEDGLRHVLYVEAGKVAETSKASGPKGTEIIIEDLFFNTPARLKFLKSNATELAGCVDVVSRYMVAYPKVAFRLIHGTKELLISSGNGELLAAVAEVWGQDVALNLAQVECVIGGIKVYGFVSPPHLTRPTRAYQWMFVNERPIRSKTLMAAFDRAYRLLTPEKRFPFVLLMLQMDPALVDVNVSPTKSEVKFQNEPQIFEVVRHAIKSSLMEHGMIPGAADIARPSNSVDPIVTSATSSDSRSDFSPKSQQSEVSQLAQAPLIEKDSATELSLARDFSDFQSIETQKYPFAKILDGLKIIGAYLKTFIVAENAKGLVLIDHHVAHERVLYEQLWKARNGSSVEKQVLLQPEPLHLDRVSSELLHSYLGELREIGFELEPFGGGSYLVRAVPAVLKGKAPILFLQEVIENLLHSEHQRELMPARDHVWISLACKMAVKAGDTLSMAEMEKLITDLAQTENPYLCPHGRPITVTLSQEDLLRKFKRSS